MEESIVSKVYDALELAGTNVVAVAVDMVACSDLRFEPGAGNGGVQTPVTVIRKTPQAYPTETVYATMLGREHSEPNLTEIALNLQL